MNLEAQLFSLRERAVAMLNAAGVKADLISTVDDFSTVRFAANLRAENAEYIFSGKSGHSSAMADLKAFDAAIGESAAAAGFGATTQFTPKHTNLRQKRKPNDGAKKLILGVLCIARPVKIVTTTTNANTIADDSDGLTEIAPDVTGYLRDFIARAVAEDYSPYVQKTGGTPKEYLGPLNWEATESGVLYHLNSYPEGWYFGGEGQGSELVVGFERTHNTRNKEWAADTDQPYASIIDAMGIAATGSQPADNTQWCAFDVSVRLIGASVAKAVR